MAAETRPIWLSSALALSQAWANFRSLMPAMQLSDADLDAVVSYMETLH